MRRAVAFWQARSMALARADATRLNKLYFGDNLAVLREHVATESVDLVYLDPPPASNTSPSDFPGKKGGVTAASRGTSVQAFDAPWSWGYDAEACYREVLHGVASPPVVSSLQAMRQLMGESGVLAYITMMTPRLIECHRILKESGSLFFHCDPAVSHYLRIILDSIFGPKNFRNEIVWQKTLTKSPATHRLPFSHDVILAYGKTDAARWNQESLFQPYGTDDLKRYPHRDPDGRRYQFASLTSPTPDRPNLTYEFLGVTRVWRWTKERMEEAQRAGLVIQPGPGREPRLKRYLDEQRGNPLGDVWTDIPPLNARAPERVGYPTQKPLALIARIIEATTRPGDLVLDPFAGSGTTIDAAQSLDRNWIGIDITTVAIDLIDARLRDRYSESVRGTYEILGTPKTLDDAQALLSRSPLEFERWCVMLVDGQPEEGRSEDKAIDGVIRIPIDEKDGSHRVLVSVKSGRPNSRHLQDLINSVDTQQAAMGLLVLMSDPARGMMDAAQRAGAYRYPLNGQEYPRIQLITVEKLIRGERPNLPVPLLPFLQARPRRDGTHTPAASGER